MTEWTKGTHTNETLNFQWGYISYNKPDNMNDIFSADKGYDETAIVVGQDKCTFFILNGDHREELELRASHSLKSCLEYYRDHKKSQSSWSSDSEKNKDQPPPDEILEAMIKRLDEYDKQNIKRDI